MHCNCDTKYIPIYDTKCGLYIKFTLYRMLCTEKTLYRMLCTDSVHTVCTGSLYRLCTGSLYRIPYVHRRCNRVPVQTVCTESWQRELLYRPPVQDVKKTCLKLYKTPVQTIFLFCPSYSTSNSQICKGGHSFFIAVAESLFLAYIIFLYEYLSFSP